MSDINDGIFRKTWDEEKMVNIFSHRVLEPRSHSVSSRVWHEIFGKSCAPVALWRFAVSTFFTVRVKYWQYHVAVFESIHMFTYALDQTGLQYKYLGNFLKEKFNILKFRKKVYPTASCPRIRGNLASGPWKIYKIWWRTDYMYGLSHAKKKVVYLLVLVK